MLSKFFSLAVALTTLKSCVMAKPAPKEYCADVLMYDTFGDGWGLDTVLHVNNETYNLISDWEAGMPLSNGSQCSTRVHRFCSEDGKFTFVLNDTSAVPTKAWEVLVAVKYMTKTFFGTVGSEIVTNGGDKVDFENILDTSAKANKCSQCAHRVSNASLVNYTYSIALKDSPRESWYSNKGPNVNIEGFQVPSVLVYPKYFITMLPATGGNGDGVQIAEGSLCSPSPKGNEICSETLMDGTYKFTVSGRAQGDESWSFCNSTGGVGDELLVSVMDGVCSPIAKTSAQHRCEVAPTGLAADPFIQKLDELLEDSTSYYLGSFEVLGVVALCVAAVMFVASKFIQKPEDGSDELPENSQSGLLQMSESVNGASDRRLNAFA